MAHNYLKFEDNDSEEFQDSSHPNIKISHDHSSIEQFHNFNLHMGTLTGSYKNSGSRPHSMMNK